MAHLERFKDPKYRRWVQLFKGLYIVKDVLCQHVEEVLKDFHQNELTATFEPYCCDALTPVWDKTTRTWSLTGGPACTHHCTDWLNRIAAEHVQYPSIRKDMFKLCNLTQLNTCPWEVAKAFLADQRKAQNTKAPAELDPYYLTRMINDCKLFTNMHSEVKKVNQTRNDLAHAAEQGISTEGEMKDKMGEMMALVKLLPKAPASTLGDLEKIRDTNLIEVDQIEMKKIKMFIQGFQQMEKELQAVKQKVEDEAQSIRQKVEEEVQAVGKKVDDLASEVKRMHTSDATGDTLALLQAELVETYLKDYSKLQPVPWSDKVSLPINLVYQEQALTGRDHGSSSELKSIFETAGTEKSRPSRILIEGPPGMGKSTLCMRLIQAWAQGVAASLSESASQPQAALQELEGSHLHSYLLTCFLIVRDLIEGNLADNLLNQLVQNRWSDKQRLVRCISENIPKVLLIVDGYDEGDEAQTRCVDRWLKGTDCRGCTLIVTSRPGFCRPKQNPDRTYTLMGLDKAKQQDFASKFDEAMGVEPGKRSVSEQLPQFQNQDFLQTPLLLALVCVLASQGQGALPKTVTGLYDEFTEFLSLKAVSGPIQFKKNYVSELLKILQKIAFQLFTLKKSEITTDELKEHVSESEMEKTMDNLCKLGLVQQEITLKSLKNSQTGEFIHQSFLDYFAARYFVSGTKEERSALLEEMAMHENMLVLAAGLCGESEEQNRECFGQMLEAWEPAVQSIQGANGRIMHSIRHACFLWLTELRDPCWLHADHITAIYQTINKASDGKGIYIFDDCTASCLCGVIALLEAAVHHRLHDSSHAPLDPATFKLDMYTTGNNISTAVQLDLLNVALLYNIPLTCECLHLPDCLTRVQCDQLITILSRIDVLQSLDISMSSLAALNIVWQGFNSTSQLRSLSVTYLPSSTCHSPPATTGHHRSPPDKLLNNISHLSKLERIELQDKESTLPTENRREIMRLFSDRLLGLKAGHTALSLSLDLLEYPVSQVLEDLSKMFVQQCWCDQLSTIFPRLTHLVGLAITVSSWTAANILLQGVHSTSRLEQLYVNVTCSRDSPPEAAAAAADDSWSPRELIDNISRFSELWRIVLTDEESTLSNEHRIEITLRLSDRFQGTKVQIYDRDSQTGKETHWEMD